MANLFFKRKVSDAENRLTMLYCVRALKQVTPAQLWQFVSWLDTMDYMTEMLLLSDLLASGELEKGEYALQGRIFLSDRGRRTLELFLDRIPKSTRDAIDRRVPEYGAQLRQKRQVSAIYESAQTGDYRLLLSLIEGDVPALEMRVHTHRRRVAVRIKEGFEKTAPTIIGRLYELAAQPRESVQQDGGATVSALSLAEYRVGARFELTPAAEMDVAILLPSEASAQSLATAIDQDGERLGQELLTLLLGE